MTKNMSNVDRGLRAIVVAPAAIVVAILLGAGSVAGIVVFAVAGIMLVTSGVGFCPLYALFHVNTCRQRPLAR